MINVTIAGNLGDDAQMRQAGDSDVCSFRVAAETDERDRKTEWFDVSIFGSYGQAMCDHLKKGGKVTVNGALTFREHEGKRYNKIKASTVALQGKPERRDDDRDDRGRDSDRDRRDSRDDRRSDSRRDDRDRDRRDDRGRDSRDDRRSDSKDTRKGDDLPY